MAWYTAECLYCSELDRAGDIEQLCETRYFLLKAEDESGARQRAWELANGKQHSYLNAEKENVKWILEDVVGVEEVLTENLSEGTEVYHKYFSRPTADRRRIAEV